MSKGTTNPSSVVVSPSAPGSGAMSPRPTLAWETRTLRKGTRTPPKRGVNTKHAQHKGGTTTHPPPAGLVGRRAVGPRLCVTMCHPTSVLIFDSTPRSCLFFVSRHQMCVSPPHSFGEPRLGGIGSRWAVTVTHGQRRMRVGVCERPQATGSNLRMCSLCAPGRISRGKAARAAHLLNMHSRAQTGLSAV